MKRATLLTGAVVSLFAVGGARATERAAVEFLNSGKVVPTGLPFSEAVRVDDLLYLSGQVGIEPGTVRSWCPVASGRRRGRRCSTSRPHSRPTGTACVM